MVKSKEYAIQMIEDGRWIDLDTYNKRNCGWEGSVESWLPKIQSEHQLPYWRRKYPKRKIHIVLRTLIEDVVIDDVRKTISNGECSA